MKGINKIILLVLGLVAVYLLFNFGQYLSGRLSNQEYVFVLDGVEMQEVVRCEKEWNYENITLIPCLNENGTLITIPFWEMNWSLSPQNNCKMYNWTFLAFNIKNDTRAKEIYDSTMPKCSYLTAEEINKEWLKENAICLKENFRGCYEWKKENLIIRIKSQEDRYGEAS